MRYRHALYCAMAYLIQFSPFSEVFIEGQLGDNSCENALFSLFSKTAWEIKRRAGFSIMQTYRSGHNGAHSKCVCPPGHEGSNPSVSVHKKGVLEGIPFLCT